MVLAVISEPTGAPSWQQQYSAQVGQDVMAGGTGQIPVYQAYTGDVTVGPAAIRAEKEAQLAAMEATAEEAHKRYYSEGGPGYGTEPGGSDVYYYNFPEWLGGPSETWDVGDPNPFFPDFDKSNLLLYAALGIGALALLRR